LPGFAVRLRGLAYTYAATRAPLEALAEVSLEIGKGEFVSLVGPSGCGKTTLLRLVAGLAEPSAGSIELGDPGRGVGYVSQSAALLPWRNVNGNIALPLELLRWPSARLRERVRELVALVGLEGFETSYPRQLSGGMQQRVALARALAHNPALLLLDEPFASLDALSREHMNEELQRVWLASGNGDAAEVKTVLMVTHSIDEAVFLSDRIVILSHRPGTVRQVIADDLARPRLAATRESPQFVELAAQVRATIQAAEMETAI
jgi:NitT/TauT family transport system ATP-binding protein